MMHLITRNLFFAVLFSPLINLPTYVVSYITHNTFPVLRWGYVGIYIAFFFFLFAIKRKGVRTGIIIFLLILEIIQMCHLAYFGSYISPLRFEEIFTETDEIFLSASGAAPHLWFIPFIAAAPWVFMLGLLKRLPPRPIPGAWALALSFIAFVGIRAYIRPLYDAYPHPNRFALINSLNSLSSYLTKFVPLKWNGSIKDYKPYQIESIGTPDNNIILVMGESFTPHHMSLFGYDRKTTPFLDSLKENPNFIYGIGYSASVNTRQSCLLFMNMVREPFFAKWIEGKRTNLFKLAQQHGYKTYYISGQRLSLLRDIGAEFIDHVITIDHQSAQFDAVSDQALILIFAEMPKEDKVFVVLHQRCAHSPYDSHYKHMPDLAQFPTQNLPMNEARKNAYDNAVLFNDVVLKEIIQHFKATATDPTYIFMTSDHGERIGENGQWGHSALDESVATVPFMLYAIDGDPKFMEDVRKEHFITHYEVGKLLTQLMGYKIDNPNEVKGEYTIVGANLFGLEGYIDVKKKDASKPPILTYHAPKFAL